MYNHHILKNENFINLDEYFSLPIYGRIYKITNLITNKIYIGQTIQRLYKRFRAHFTATLRGSETYIHRSMRKYGVENFIIEEIDSAFSLDELNQKEYDWIVKENCLAPNGYNLKNGGEMNGCSQETREKQSCSALKVHQNYKWFHHPETFEQIFINPEYVPFGFVSGMAKRSWYYHPENKIESLFTAKDIIPEGFIRGRIKDETGEISARNKNSKYYHNPKTGQRLRLHQHDIIPEGFIIGYK